MMYCSFIKRMSFKLAPNVRALRSAGHLENVQPEAEADKDTKVKNMFC